jgi:hypothetical protein
MIIGGLSLSWKIIGGFQYISIFGIDNRSNLKYRKRLSIIFLSNIAQPFFVTLSSFWHTFFSSMIWIYRLLTDRIVDRRVRNITLFCRCYLDLIPISSLPGIIGMAILWRATDPILFGSFIIKLGLTIMICSSSFRSNLYFTPNAFIAFKSHAFSVKQVNQAKRKNILVP